VVATTSIVGDVVRNVGGEAIDLSVLIPVNVDEHGYEPIPQDAAKIAQASLVFENGAGLEQFIEKLMQNAGDRTHLVSVSDGVTLLQGALEDEVQPDQTPVAGKKGDPHVWLDPNNVLIWVQNIEQALSSADPQHAADYKKNADQYRQQLKDLDTWIQQQIEQVPQDRRKLVTDHLIFTYFARRYRFEQVGAVVPGYSTLSSPSAQELAQLEDQVRKLAVPAIFVGNTVNPTLADRVAQDTHTKLAHILTGSLTDQQGAGPTYIEYMKYNVNAIVKALK
jgi:ABC-type Zn uptake system ZnuABC Zn-binding protein ZnuA